MVGETPDERRSRPLSNNLRDDRLPRAEYLDLAVWHGFKVDFKVILVSETYSPQGGLRRMDTFLRPGLIVFLTLSGAAVRAGQRPPRSGAKWL